ncbi:response regulator transcription factor [Flavobacterium sp. SUN052]|uniref:response regulator n=1 Tax=Flavobacterium sp. SUN052 TaxID=3002441 RepID=UPI00237E81AB|nr:response regulator transcription factor [Flavobacterium sp. SUN052]MEC4003028.1 response regulator transcription factor [Flavobacterium sp. SUN052]
MAKEINILLVDDHLVVRKGVELILKDALKEAIVYQAENYDEAIEVIKAIKLDLILLDINIRGVENIKIMKTIKEIQSYVKILIFTSHDENQYALRYMQNGADGFLNKFCSEEKVVIAIKQILDKGSYISNQIETKLNANLSKKKLVNSIESLSNREFEIAKLLIDGYGNLEISNKLDIQMSTVSTYKNRIFEKLSINNIVSLSQLFNEAENLK